MGENSAISWTTHTFNSHWGCQRVSPGCGLGKSVGGCYAEAFAKRLGLDLWGPSSPRRFFGEEHWRKPLKWNRDAEKAGERARVFCASMADVFEDRRDLDGVRERLWSLIESTPALDWQLLTKRPENMVRLAPARWADGWPSNVWAGCTAENQEWLERRLPHLVRVPARVRFLSCEPLLGPLHLGLQGVAPKDWGKGYRPVGSLIHWVIVGGESGGGSRAFELDWARDIIIECGDAEVACWFKQAGANPWDGKKRLRLVDRMGGELGELPPELHVRQLPEAA